MKKIHVKDALVLLEECPLLHIEDLLPYLPDLAAIDDVRYEQTPNPTRHRYVNDPKSLTFVLPCSTGAVYVLHTGTASAPPWSGTRTPSRYRQSTVARDIDWIGCEKGRRERRGIRAGLNPPFPPNTCHFFESLHRTD